MQAVTKLLGHAPLQPTDVLLDIGIGTGEITSALARRVQRAIGTGLQFQSYGARGSELQARSINPVECVCEALAFPNKTFDVVVMSHILEHAPNVALALDEVRRVLKPGGLLCVLVPPSESLVAGGHISVGWNIGQLMYVLAVNGFDTEAGNYVRLGYNICAFVRRDDRPLPPLRHDFGDLLTLAADKRWPLPIVNVDPEIEAFNGDLQALNWPWLEVFPPRHQSVGGWLLRRLVPAALKPWLSNRLNRAARALMDNPAHTEIATINPKALSQ